MNKILVVAKNEFVIAVTSKAFLVGLIMMPIFMCGALVVQHLTKDQIDLTPRKIAIVDYSGKLSPVLEEAAKQRNEHGIFEATESADSESRSGDNADSDGGGDAENASAADRKQIEPEFQIEVIAPDSAESEEALALQLSDRVRSGELFAYAIISENAYQPGAKKAVRYFSESPSYGVMSNWIQGVISQQVAEERMQALNLTPEKVAAATAPISVHDYGLMSRSETGEITDAKEENKIVTFAVPFGGLMLMFMMVMSVAPSMLNNVLEEKIQKISEFLVSSVTPFQLMMGKLVGAIAVGLTLSTIYLGAAYGLAWHFEIADEIPLSLFAWFIFFLLLALIIFGSVFSAIGAACSEIRDAQSLMTPVMLFIIIPMMCLGPILQSPSSTFAKAMSLFPPATPLLMFLRIAIPPGPEIWEIILGAVLALVFAAGCVWAGGRIFRIGILSQGQAPSLGRLIMWVFSRQ